MSTAVLALIIGVNMLINGNRKAGGTCNGPPGLRPQYAEGYYAAFVTDLDGHNMEACFIEPK